MAKKAMTAEEIVEKLSHEQHIDENYLPFGDGHSAERIVSALERQ
jgi:UDP-N-acetylglucosamine 2-epimerase